MNNKLCLLILSVVAVSAQRYNLEQRSNKLFGKTFNQVLEEFRGTPEYLEMLAQRVSNWKRSAKLIFLELEEDQTSKFLDDVENMDMDESYIYTRRNKRKKTSIELLDENSYAKLDPKDVLQLINLASKHFDTFLHSYMEALSPGSSNSNGALPKSDDSRRRHVLSSIKLNEIKKILKNRKRLAPKELEVSKNLPEKYPKQRATKQKMLKQWMPKKKAANQDLHKEPAWLAQEMPLESEAFKGVLHKEILGSKTQRMPKQGVQPYQGVQKQGEPKQVGPNHGIPKQVIPKYEVPKQGVPKQGVQKQGLPKQGVAKQGVPKQEVLKQGLPKQEVPKQEIPKHELQQGMPKQAVPRQGILEQALPDQGILKHEVPKQGVRKQEAPAQVSNKPDLPKKDTVMKEPQVFKTENMPKVIFISEEKHPELEVN